MPLPLTPVVERGFAEVQNRAQLSGKTVYLVTPSEILLCVLQEEGSIAAETLQELGLDILEVKKFLEKG